MSYDQPICLRPSTEEWSLADKRFFERFPRRSYCVRYAGENEARRAAASSYDKPSPGFRHFTLVRQIAPGLRVRAVITARADLDTNVSEAAARKLWRDAGAPS